MDPLSIAASAAGLATACVKISGVLYTWIDETIEIDSTVSQLCEEIAALSRVLESISKAYTQAPSIVISGMDPDGRLWITVRASLDDLQGTLDKLNQLLREVQKSSLFGRGFLRRPAKQIKYSFKVKDITIYRERIKSYNSAMTSTLQMINV